MSQGMSEYESISEYEKVVQEQNEEADAEQHDFIISMYNRGDDETWFHEPKYAHVYQCDLVDISGHEWVGSETRLPRPYITMTGDVVDTRQEFLEPISLITDRTFDEDAELPAHSVICAYCHLTCNQNVKCPNCDEVNA